MAALTTFSLNHSLWQEMFFDITRHLPLESCGLVAGRRHRHQWKARLVIPVANVLASATRFRMSPEEQLEAFQRIDRSGWELIAIYHSHPAGPSFPSQTDLAEHYYPEALALIWSSVDHHWDCRAYLVDAQKFAEIEILVIG